MDDYIWIMKGVNKEEGELETEHEENGDIPMEVEKENAGRAVIGQDMGAVSQHSMRQVVQPPLRIQKEGDGEGKDDDQVDDPETAETKTIFAILLGACCICGIANSV